MSLNLIFDSYYGVGDPVKIKAFEVEVKRVLPESYKSIVSEFNGAYVVNKPMFKFYNRLLGQPVEAGSGMFLPFGYVEDSFETMEIKHRYPPEGFVDGLVIFSSLGNGDALCFDYRTERNSINPSVVVWHHEAISGSKSEISEVAPSFDGFLGLLHEEQ